MSPSSHLAQAYAQRGHELDRINAASPWHAAYRELTNPVISSLAIDATTILDAAAGTALATRGLARSNRVVVAADILSTMTRIAYLDGPVALRDRTYAVVQASIDRLPIRSDSVDLVVHAQALNFIESPHEVFSEFARVLKPGATLFFDIDTPYRWAVIEALSGRIDNATFIMNRNHDGEEAIVGAPYFFHPLPSLEEILVRHGFEVTMRRGILWAMPLIHIFAKSREFLSSANLSPIAQQFLPGSSAYRSFLQLEEAMAKTLPIEQAGWVQWACKKR